MATKQSTVDFLLDQLTETGLVSARKMFGEYALYFDGKVVALVCDDALFIKPTANGEAFLGHIEYGDPYPGSKPYFRIPEEKWDDRHWLQELVTVTAAALPPPKKKQKS